MHDVAKGADEIDVGFVDNAGNVGGAGVSLIHRCSARRCSDRIASSAQVQTRRVAESESRFLATKKFLREEPPRLRRAASRGAFERIVQSRFVDAE